MQEPGRREGYQKISDEQLVALARSGSELDFEALMSRYLPLVKARTASYLGVSLEREDLAQEGLIGLMSASRTFDASCGASFRTYARHCIDRSILSALRSARALRKIPNSALVSIDDHSGAGLSLTERLSAGKADNPEVFVIQMDEKRRMEQELSQLLSAFECRVLFLFFDGCSYDEIAQRLRITPKAVDNALQRVRRKLKKF